MPKNNHIKINARGGDTRIFFYKAKYSQEKTKGQKISNIIKKHEKNLKYNNQKRYTTHQIIIVEHMVGIAPPKIKDFCPQMKILKLYRV